MINSTGRISKINPKTIPVFYNNVNNIIPKVVGATKKRDVKPTIEITPQKQPNNNSVSYGPKYGEGSIFNRTRATDRIIRHNCGVLYEMNESDTDDEYGKIRVGTKTFQSSAMPSSFATMSHEKFAIK